MLRFARLFLRIAASTTMAVLVVGSIPPIIHPCCVGISVCTDSETEKEKRSPFPIGRWGGRGFGHAVLVDTDIQRHSSGSSGSLTRRLSQKLSPRHWRASIASNAGTTPTFGNCPFLPRFVIPPADEQISTLHVTRAWAAKFVTTWNHHLH